MSAVKRKTPDQVYDASDDAKTPTGSPPAKRLRLTRNQKQALIDNLQLEITERARKLRAQYALQAHDLRARIERRVNRIPVALRKATMGELLEKQTAALRSPRKIGQTGKAAIRNVTAMSVDMHGAPTSAHVRRVKKHSQENYSDKENAPAAGEPVDVLKNPKRRANGGASRVVSQEVRGADYRILSPKSLNSRTYPQSPFRASPDKTQNPLFASRPMSPLKPSSPLKATTGARTARGAAPVGSKDPMRPASQAKKTTARSATASRAVPSPISRPATRQRERKTSTGTVSSTASSGTTVAKTTRTGTGTTRKGAAATAAKKPTTTARGQTASMAVKRTTAIATTVRKATAPAAVEAPATGRRVLRKRA
ncbi:hypothetical protein ASPZODRAFT_159782 [Penicilliopsis zonata CBS 506.65]|uniref:Borealin N-terminal domain-containing protein n=1 Tax=Penicilliopsis zonata CBS 506.65 TaxID=1073090 RepID=A0A1L9SGD4_9EURO|nr:hypothetical protein ASPZODRAFT_159782 [Penicilliopsis zonata CBS 506.65]OJJ46239.1 hypothetical protein ASPZODRAFT_159782 [Penicilliopsis zonata CBS 506.65]